jgi:hypothetical protein
MADLLSALPGVAPRADQLATAMTSGELPTALAGLSPATR